MSTSEKSHSYTDQHDVDEDLRTNVKRGGICWRGGGAGITAQELFNDPTTTSDGVASKK